MTSMPRSSAVAISARGARPAVDRDDDRRPPAAAASIAASDRPWPSSRRLGTYGSTSTPNRRRAMTRMARPSRPSASKSPKTMTRSPRSRARVSRSSGRSASGRSIGSWRPASGSANQAVEPGRIDARRDAPGGRSGARRGRARSAAVEQVAGSTGPDSGKVQRKRGSSTALRMPRGACPRLTGHRTIAARGSGRGAAGSRRARGGSRPWRRSSHACQSTSSGLATKIDEYVPMMMPMSRARTKSLMAAPPNRNSASSVMQHGQAGRDRAPERLQDRVVDDLVERLAEVARLVLADPVEHDDRVVDAEADDGQHRGHEQGVDLDVEERARGSANAPTTTMTSWSSETSAVTPNFSRGSGT